ncbi:hypothetical protein STAQ_30690 [Allostella sp. ATCC 35155]|nr:hypothetical protein STAQ_30690 [Stella sp. ATCC 35155]
MVACGDILRQNSLVETLRGPHQGQLVNAPLFNAPSQACFQPDAGRPLGTVLAIGVAPIVRSLRTMPSRRCFQPSGMAAMALRPIVSRAPPAERPDVAPGGAG